MNFYVAQFKKHNRPFYWIRLTEASQKKLLANNSEKFVDADIRRKYNLDLYTKGVNVYNVTQRDKEGKIKKKKLMARILALSTFYNDKGVGYFDNEFLNDEKMYYNICLDEMNREVGEKNSFDIAYSFIQQMENLVRSTKKRVRIILIGNTLEEASDIMTCFNFLPEEWGRFKLKSKRAVVEYMEPTEAYKKRRAGTVADLLAGDHSNFTNKIDVDKTLLYKGRLEKPMYAISFTKKDKFTVWEGLCITEYNGEKINEIPMRPYLDKIFTTEKRDNIIELFDTRCFCFRNLITQKKFKKCLESLRKAR